MTAAEYEHGMDETAPNISGLKNEFIILVDTAQKATNFVSFLENHALEQANHPTAPFSTFSDTLEKLTKAQKEEKIEREKLAWKKQADSVHLVNNQGQQQIWIVNNSKDTVTIQMQGWSYICVLQAMTKSGQWLPIQYWRFASFGSFHRSSKYFAPNTANSFITKLPDDGDYQTKLRFKLLGADKFYYSNEFDGRINYCEFVEDSTSYDKMFSDNKPHYKLDSILHLVKH